MYLPKPTEGGDFEPAPAGTFVATCYRFIDRGTQMKDYNGDKKTRHEVMLTWEIADELMSDGRPFSASKVYTWSMHEKAGLRKDLESWRGKSFVDDDFEGPNAFNTKKLIGAPCTLTITHSTKDGKTFAQIAGIGKMMKGITAPPLTNPKAYLALEVDGWSPEIYANLSDKMKQIIAGSPEYKDLMMKLAKPEDHHEDGGAGRFDDDIPF